MIEKQNLLHKKLIVLKNGAERIWNPLSGDVYKGKCLGTDVEITISSLFYFISMEVQVMA